MHRIVTRTWLALVVAVALGGAAAAQSQPAVTITYWQYYYESKVKTLDALIPQFERQNPGIHVVQQTFPYDSYNQKVASAVPAGQGPDVVNLYYGWLPLYVDSGYLQPLPADAFPTAQIERDFAPMVKAAQFDGKFWALPTAVRTLAIFYNRDLFQRAGITRAPATWEEFTADAQRLTERDSRGRITTEGFGIAPNGQDHSLLREVLFRQWGASPYSADGRRVTYNTAAGAAALRWYTDLVTKEKVGAVDFFPGSNGYRDAFLAGRAGMIIDGSFAIGTVRSGAKFNWGVALLPRRTAGGTPGNFGSFWVHGLTRRAIGPRRAAAVAFLKFITSSEVQRTWLQQVGEIPAAKALAADPKLAQDPVYGPFIASLPFAHATFFVDETAQRTVLVDAVNEVVLNHMDPKAALDAAAGKEQKILDAFWAKQAKHP
ncbi:MAG TPA: extracellular solute-binding protein [bacterium]|nr:extracellular solute-binding protein [bacterium]